MTTLAIAEKKLQDRLKKSEQELEKITEASGLLEQFIEKDNKFINAFRNELYEKEVQLEKRIGYMKSELEGPWMDSDGRINKGHFMGLYIIPLLEAFAASAKDFPTAMNLIGHAAKDHEIMAREFTMYPQEDARSKSAYGLLIKLAPNADWDKAQKIYWDT